MNFINGKLENKKHLTNQHLLSEFLEEKTHTNETAIICVVKSTPTFRLNVDIFITIKSNYVKDYIKKFEWEYNFDIQKDKSSKEDDKIDLFKHLLNAYREAYREISLQRLSDNDEYKQKNIPVICDEVVDSLEHHGYYT